MGDAHILRFSACRALSLHIRVLPLDAVFSVKELSSTIEHSKQMFFSQCLGAIGASDSNDSSDSPVSIRC